MRLIALIVLLALTPAAFAQQDNVRCAPAIQEWNGLSGSSNVQDLRAFERTVPSYCPVLAETVGSRIISIELAAAEEEKARLDRLAADQRRAASSARAELDRLRSELQSEASTQLQQQQEELAALRAEIEEQKALNAEREAEQAALIASQKEELARLQAEREEAQLIAQREAEAREAAERRRIERERAQLAAEERRREEESRRQAEYAKTDWLIGIWQHDTTRYGGYDLTGEVEFTRRNDGGIRAVVTTRQEKDSSEYVTFEPRKLRIDGSRVEMDGGRIIKRTWGMWSPDNFELTRRGSRLVGRIHSWPSSAEIEFYKVS